LLKIENTTESFVREIIISIVNYDVIIDDSLAQVIRDDVRVETGGLNHDEEAVVAADQVTQVLPGLNLRVVTTNQEEKQLSQLVKLTSL
jgi:hypothetical protein